MGYGTELLVKYCKKKPTTRAYGFNPCSSTTNNLLRRLIMATKIKGLDVLEQNGLKVVRKYNICGWFEYHVLNEAGQRISRHTVQQRAVDMALHTLQA